MRSWYHVPFHTSQPIIPQSASVPHPPQVAAPELPLYTIPLPTSSHPPAQPHMPPAFHCACIPYNDAWPPHRLSAYGNSVCSFCHAKHWIEEKQQSSTMNNPEFSICCHAGKGYSI